MLKISNNNTQSDIVTTINNNVDAVKYTSLMNIDKLKTTSNRLVIKSFIFKNETIAEKTINIVKAFNSNFIFVYFNKLTKEFETRDNEILEENQKKDKILVYKLDFSSAEVQYIDLRNNLFNQYDSDVAELKKEIEELKKFDASTTSSDNVVDAQYFAQLDVKEQETLEKYRQLNRIYDLKTDEYVLNKVKNFNINEAQSNANYLVATYDIYNNFNDHNFRGNENWLTARKDSNNNIYLVYDLYTKEIRTEPDFKKQYCLPLFKYNYVNKSKQNYTFADNSAYQLDEDYKNAYSYAMYLYALSRNNVIQLTALSTTSLSVAFVNFKNELKNTVKNQNTSFSFNFSGTTTNYLYYNLIKDETVVSQTELPVSYSFLYLYKVEKQNNLINIVQMFNNKEYLKQFRQAVKTKLEEVDNITKHKKVKFDYAKSLNSNYAYFTLNDLNYNVSFSNNEKAFVRFNYFTKALTKDTIKKNPFTDMVFVQENYIIELQKLQDGDWVLKEIE